MRFISCVRGERRLYGIYSKFDAHSLAEAIKAIEYQSRPLCESDEKRE